VGIIVAVLVACGLIGAAVAYNASAAGKVKKDGKAQVDQIHGICVCIDVSFSSPFFVPFSLIRS